jgi:hypothetical protein
MVRSYWTTGALALAGAALFVLAMQALGDRRCRDQWGSLGSTRFHSEIGCQVKHRGQWIPGRLR